MLKRQLICSTAAILLLLGIIGPKSAHAGSLIFNISANTSPLGGQSGFLDLQFNPGDSSAEAATATVTLFQTTGGILVQPASLTGDAAGSLPGTLTFDNGTAFNDAFQGFTFGTSFGFTLTLSGPAIDNPGGTTGSTFALSLYAADEITPLLTTDPNGSIATINLNANGTASAEVFPQSPNDNTPAGIVTPLNAVPEPSTIVMILCSLPVGILLWRRSHSRSPSDQEN